MKLTNSIRDAFIRAVLADVPSIGYEEKISKAARADAAAQLPPKVRTIYNDKALSHFVATAQRRVGGTYITVPTGGDYQPSAAVIVEIEHLVKANTAQADQRNALRLKLRGCAYACSTKKALVEMLPEFENYLPADEAAACRTLPVVANVMADFVKAGWPAGKGKARAPA